MERNASRGAWFLNGKLRVLVVLGVLVLLPALVCLVLFGRYYFPDPGMAAAAESYAKAHVQVPYRNLSSRVTRDDQDWGYVQVRVELLKSEDAQWVEHEASLRVVKRDGSWQVESRGGLDWQIVRVLPSPGPTLSLPVPGGEPSR